jgi:NAD(P)-dependent dehydrogenase (short-subunit alcohol dehydrogenase family)
MIMPNSVRHGIIIGASSDIGLALSRHFLESGFSILGSFRKSSFELEELRSKFTGLIQSDFSDSSSVDQLVQSIKSLAFRWDFIIVCPATMQPIGKFKSCQIDDWEQSIKINFLSQLRLLHGVLPLKQNFGTQLPTVIFFAGGGTNSAPLNFSAYTISKIALIKAVELLDAENEEVCFTILGPGWIKTKIHSETLESRDASGQAYYETSRRFTTEEFTPMSRVIDCCEWLLGSSKDVIGGRNFSLVYDQWGNDKLNKLLKENYNMYKLRRHGNDLTI